MLQQWRMSSLPRTPAVSDGATMLLPLLALSAQLPGTLTGSLVKGDV